MKMRSIKARVSGRVQGVYFRASTKKRADSLQLQGWVANEDDGSVLCCAQGVTESVEDFVRYLEKGPPLARVDALELEDCEIDTDLQDFRVIR